MSANPFETYAKKALSPAPARLIGVTKTRAEAKAVYVAIVGELALCRTLADLRVCLNARSLEILQIQAELEFLWFGDGHDFLGLEREIESAFEGCEAATYFSKFPPALHEQQVCEVGRLPGQSQSTLKQELRP